MAVRVVVAVAVRVVVVVVAAAATKLNGLCVRAGVFVFLCVFVFFVPLLFSGICSSGDVRYAVEKMCFCVSLLGYVIARKKRRIGVSDDLPYSRYACFWFITLPRSMNELYSSITSSYEQSLLLSATN